MDDKNYDYAYIFAIGGQIQWSSQTHKSLVDRVDGEDKNMVLDYLESNPNPGSFIVLDNKDMVFRIRRS